MAWAADELTCDFPFTGSLAPNEVDELTIRVENEEILSFTFVPLDPTAPGFDPAWRLLRADGLPASTCGGWTQARHADCGPLPTSAGPYRMEIADWGADAGGAYRVHLQRLTALRSCESTPLICDVVLDGVIEDQTDSDLVAFSVDDGERISLTAAPIQPAPGFEMIWRLLQADGSAAPFCGGWNNPGEVDCGPLPAWGNPYRIEIKDAGENVTGNYRLRMQTLAAPSACDQRELSCDVILSGSIENPLDSDLLAFPVADGEWINLTVVPVLPEPGFNPAWRLLQKDGSPAPSFGGWSDSRQADCGPLPASGSPYRVQVKDWSEDAVGSYRVILQRLSFPQSCEQTPLECDVPLDGTIDDPIDSDLLTFQVSEGERIALTMVPISPAPGFEPHWRLLQGDGTAAPSCWNWNGAGYIECGPLPAWGNPYRIAIKDYGEDVAGAYRIHLQRLTASAVCEAIPLQCDVPCNGRIDDRTDTDLLRFSVADGERISVTAVPISPAPGFDLFWRLVQSDGSPVYPYEGWHGPGFVDQGPLPARGNPYHIEVRDAYEDLGGDYRFTLQRLTASQACDPVPLACDIALDGALEDRTDSDLLSFAATEGERISVTIVPVNPLPGFDLVWRLLQSNGSPAPSGGGWNPQGFSDCGPLPSSGSPFQIQVRDSNEDVSGSYRVRFQRLAAGVACEATPLVCDVPLSETIGERTDSDLLSFAVSDGERFSLTVVPISPPPGFEVLWRLLRADGSAVFPSGEWRGQGVSDCGPLSAAASPYRLEIKDSGEDVGGTYRVHLQGLNSFTACDRRSLRCEDSPLTGVIDDRTDSDLLQFVLADGDEVTVMVQRTDPSEPGFAPIWRLLETDGRPAVSCGDWTGSEVVSCGPLPVGGVTYQLEVKDGGEDATGTYRSQIYDCAPTTALDPGSAIPASLGISVLSSNPVRLGGPPVMLRVDLPWTAHLSLEVIDVSGRMVDRLLSETRSAGTFELPWSPDRLPSGLYYCSLRVAGETRIMRLVVVK